MTDQPLALIGMNNNGENGKRIKEIGMVKTGGTGEQIGENNSLKKN